MDPIQISAEQAAPVKKLQKEREQLSQAIAELIGDEVNGQPKSAVAALGKQTLEREVARLDDEILRELSIMAGGGASGGPVLAKGQPMRAAVGDTGSAPTLGQIVRGRGFGDWRGMSGEAKALIQSGDAGGALPGAITAGIVDLARETSCVFQAGAGVMALEGPNAKVARLTSGPTAQWAPESAERSLDDQAFVLDSVDLAVHTAFLYTSVSIEASEDVVNLDETIRNHFSRQLQLIFDEAGLVGSGVNMPVGICNMGTADDRIIESNAIGALVDHRPFVRAMGAVRAKHYQPTSVVLTPGLWTELNCLQDTTNQPLRAPKAYTDLSEFTSSFLPDNGGVGTDEHSAIVGDLSAMVFGVRTGATLEVSRLGDGFKKGSIEIRAYIRFGMYLVRPEAICVMRGITLPAAV